MPSITIKETAAATAVGTNLMAGNREQFVGRIRKVQRIGVVGSTNPGDASVDVYYGKTYVGTYFNTTGGANLIPLESKDMLPIAGNLALEPNEGLNILVSDASAGNILAITLEIVEY